MSNCRCVDIDELKDRLRQSKMEVSLRGHTWDVADVVDVLEDAAEDARVPS